MNRLLIGGASLALLLLAGASVAAPVTYEFTATATSENRGMEGEEAGFAPVDPADRLIDEGFELTGRFTYDPSVAGDPFSGSFVGTGFPAITSLKGNLGGNLFSAVAGGLLVVDAVVDLDPDPVGEDLRDLFQIISTTNGSLSGVIVGDGEFELTGFRLFYIEGSTPFYPLFADALPATLPPPDPAAGRIRLDFDELENPGFIRTVFWEPVSLRVVPVPPAFLLFGSGLSLLGWLRRGRVSGHS